MLANSGKMRFGGAERGRGAASLQGALATRTRRRWMGGSRAIWAHVHVTVVSRSESAFARKSAIVSCEAPRGQVVDLRAALKEVLPSHDEGNS